jgi:hypothetical protein
MVQALAATTSRAVAVKTSSRLGTGHDPEHGAQQVATADEQGEDRAHGLGHGKQRGRRLRCRLGFAQQRNQGQQRDRHQILEQQDGKGQAAIPRGEFLAFGQQLQPDRGGREREAQPDHDVGFPAQPVAGRERAEQQGRDRHLQSAHAEHVAPHHPQACRRQFQPDHEQQHHHTELRGCEHAFRIRHQLEPVRADRHARREIAQHRAQPQASEQGHSHHRSQQENQGDLERSGSVHAYLLARLWPSRHGIGWPCANTAWPGSASGCARAIQELVTPQ